MTDVSVVMGVYNGGEQLMPTLKSILNQQHVDFELIVVNDGSTDTSAEILTACAQQDQRIRILQNPSNLGLTRSLIKACDQAQSQYIARQDIGDLSFPNRLSIQKQILDQHPKAALVTCGYRFVGPQGELLNDVLPKHNANDWTHILLHGDETTLYGPHHGTVMFRKAAYQAAGGYRPEFYYAQDLDLWTRMVQFGTIEYSEQILYEAPFSPGGISGQFGEQQRQLKHLIAAATRNRRIGESEEDILKQAAGIRHKKSDNPQAVLAASHYFIGSCLAERGDSRARHYLAQALYHRPLMLKAWVKLLLSLIKQDKSKG